MKRIINSRRAIISLFAITCLTLIALKNQMDTSMAIASVAVGLAASNSYQRKGSAPETKPDV